MKRFLRLLSLLMLVVAVIFLGIALTHPELGTVFYVGNWRVGVEVWQTFYVVYAVVMIGTFLLSFFVR
jgi:hypothetical protein